MTLNTEVYDSATMHDNVTNSDRITIPAGGAGTYIVHGRATVTGSNNGTVGIHLRKNGSALTPSVRHYFQTGASDWEDQDLQVTASLVLAAGDYVSLYGETSGNTFNFTGQLSVIGPFAP